MHSQDSKPYLLNTKFDTPVNFRMSSHVVHANQGSSLQLSA